MAAIDAIESNGDGGGGGVGGGGSSKSSIISRHSKAQPDPSSLSSRTPSQTPSRTPSIHGSQPDRNTEGDVSPSSISSTSTTTDNDEIPSSLPPNLPPTTTMTTTTIATTTTTTAAPTNATTETTQEQQPEEPDFPQLQNNASSETLAAAAQPQKGGGGGSGSLTIDGDDNDEEPAIAKPFVRTSSPDPISSAAAAAARGEGSVADISSNANEYYDELDDADMDFHHETKAGPGPSSNAAGAGASTGPSASRRRRLFYRMHKFTLYETASRYYIVGGDVTERRYRILKVDRNTHECGEGDDDSGALSITDDGIVYSPREMNALLDTIDDGNRSTGGIKQRSTAWGLLGFIKFTGPYYMLLITKKSTVAMVGGHYIYQVDGTELIPLTPPKYKADVRNTEESRFLAILNNLDLTRSFYYSYSYDITRSLQHNITRERTALIDGLPTSTYDDYNSMFVWNSHLIKPAEGALHDTFDWCRPIIHGYIDQAAISIYGRTAHITIIARRSRFFAGARFLKRGANDLGYVANDVETEQVVSESLTTSFHLPGPKLFASPQYTSYVQHRGSIPLYWTQDNTGVTPKPPIELNLVDPFYTAAALHFDNLFERYGSPIYVLNLIKAKERTPRESKLLDEYTNAINYLNQFLPREHRIIHKAWDMSRAAKSRDQNVIGTLENIAESVVTTTGFFHNGDGIVSPMQVQNGVARTNCIDCLDRTNAAQFVIGKRALGYQLHALGIIEEPSVEYDTDAVNLFTHMWHDHGDTIAVQYGGSQLVNTMETYRKINQWTSHSRDMIESFKRYYNNSFMDSQRQEAYNLFLGNYTFTQGQPMLWDLSTDYYLHHADPRAWSQRVSRHYIHWYTPKHLEKRSLPAYQAPKRLEGPPKPVSFYDDYWLEYYRPATLSSFMKMFPYKMNSTIKYIPFKSTQEGKYDLSPFRVRNEDREGDPSEKKKAFTKKEVVIVDPQQEARDKHNKKVRARVAAANSNNSLDNDNSRNNLVSIVEEKPAGSGGRRGHSRGISIQRWLQPMSQTESRSGPLGGPPQSIMKEHSADYHQQQQQQQHRHGYSVHDYAPAYRNHSSKAATNAAAAAAAIPFRKKHKQTPLEKSRAAQWTIKKVVHESLNPSVSGQEMEDYLSYVTHPQTLPLVVSDNNYNYESPGPGVEGDDNNQYDTAAVAEYRDYLRGHTSWVSQSHDHGQDQNQSQSRERDRDREVLGVYHDSVPGVIGRGLGGYGHVYVRAGSNATASDTEDTTVNGGSMGATYAELLKVGESPLTVLDGDFAKKRYKAYGKWLRGKSLFKQPPVD